MWAMSRALYTRCVPVCMCRVVCDVSCRLLRTVLLLLLLLLLCVFELLTGVRCLTSEERALRALDRL